MPSEKYEAPVLSGNVFSCACPTAHISGAPPLMHEMKQQCNRKRHTEPQLTAGSKGTDRRKTKT